MVKYPSLYHSGEVLIQFKQGDHVLQTHGQKVIVPHYKINHWNNFRMVIQTFDNLEKADSISVLFANGDRFNILLQKLEISLASF
jgi:hypothetical protein